MAAPVPPPALVLAPLPTPASVPVPALAPVPAPAPVLPAALAPATAAQPATTPSTWSIVFPKLYFLFWVFGSFTGTYFCASALSKPWEKSHIAVIITLVTLLVLDLLAFAQLLEDCLLDRFPGVMTTATRKKLKNYRGRCFYPSWLVASSMGTYLIVHELSLPWKSSNTALIIILFFLGILDIIGIMGVIAFVSLLALSACEYIKPKQQAERNWTRVSTLQRVRVTREQAQAHLWRDLENAV
jgi:hypothetical protein